MSCFDCEDCGPDYVCRYCQPMIVAAPETSAPPEIRSTDWVDEWIAALSQLERAIDKTETALMTPEDWTRASVALMALEKIVDPKRRHSSTGRLSDGRTAT